MTSEGTIRVIYDPYGVRDFTVPDVGEGTCGIPFVLGWLSFRIQELSSIQQLAIAAGFYTVAAQRVH
jgi:hypothetical protein